MTQPPAASPPRNASIGNMSFPKRRRFARYRCMLPVVVCKCSMRPEDRSLSAGFDLYGLGVLPEILPGSRFSDHAGHIQGAVGR